MYNLNINKSSIVPTNLIVGRVLDKPFDTIQFKIYDGLDVMDLTGCTLEFRGITPDNKKVTSTAIKILDVKSGEIEFTFPPNFYSAKGHFQNAYFVIKKGTNSESTNDLLITVLNAVDFNLDDAPIIIDQLDDLIQAVIDDLNNQLSKVKGDIKQTQENINALKKDVDAYKGQFDTEISKMQKQLDNLAKAINQTDIQRPQLTKPNGEPLIILDDSTSKTLLDKFREVNAFTYNSNFIAYVKNSKNQPSPNLTMIVNMYSPDSYTIIKGIGINDNGNVYNYIRSRDGEFWNKIDGQVSKITQDDGTPIYRFDDKNNKLSDMIKVNRIPIGIYKVYINNSLDMPDVTKGLNGLLNITYINQDGNYQYNFIGSDYAFGGNYSNIHNYGNDSGFVRLDGQVQKITKDNGGYTLLTSSDKTTLESFKELGVGVHFVYIKELKDTPTQYLKGLVTVSSVSDNEITFIGEEMLGGKGTYSYNGMNNTWKRLDGQVPKITKDDGKPTLVINSPDITLQDELSKLKNGLHYIHIDNSKDQPEKYIKGMVTIIGNGEEIVFTGVAILTGNSYAWSYANKKSNWKRLDNVTPPNVSSTQNGLMLATDKVKLDNKPLVSIKTLSTSDINYNTSVILNDDIDNYEYIDVVINFEGNTTSSRNLVTGNAMTVNISGVNLYNADSSTGWNIGELTLDITYGNRAKVIRTKVVDYGGRVENNVDKIRVISIQGINKLK